MAFGYSATLVWPMNGRLEVVHLDPAQLLVGNGYRRNGLRQQRRRQGNGQHQRQHERRFDHWLECNRADEQLIGLNSGLTDQADHERRGSAAREPADHVHEPCGAAIAGTFDKSRCSSYTCRMLFHDTP